MRKPLEIIWWKRHDSLGNCSSFSCDSNIPLVKINTQNGRSAMMSEKTPDAKYDRVPSDLIRDILLRLPARSISRFRCVSKSWLSITTDPSFLLAHTSRSSNSLLIHTTKNHSDGSDLRSISLQLLSPAPTPSADRLVISTVLPERRRSSSDVVLASCDGLICLRDKLRETLELEEDVPCYYVVNPLSGFHINVPKPSCSLGHLMGLYFHPPTREYRLIRRISSKSILDKVELITLGGDAWRTIDPSPPRASVCARTPINFNGSLYWIAYNTTEFKATDILQFDAMEEEFNLMPLPPVNLHLFANSSLIDMGERLGLSIIDRELSSVCKLGIDIWVLKDNENFRWEQMYSVRCSGGPDRIDFRFGYSVDDIALFTNGKMVILFVGPRSYLVQFDLNSRKYCTEQILDLEDIMWHFSLLHKESLISYDSFCNNR